MGLLKHLLFWPVTGPKFLIDFSMGKVEDVVKEELTDDAAVKSALLELQLELELGDIDDKEYVRREAELMAQLRDIREWRERFGMGVSGGPVRVQSAGAGEAEAENRPAERDVARAGGNAEPADGSSGLARPEGVRVELDLDWDR